MTFNINKFVREYKKVLVQLLVVELVRGLLIVWIAWLLQSGIRNGEFGIVLITAMIGRIALENIRIKRFNELSLDFQRKQRSKLHKTWFAGDERGQSGKLLTLMFDIVESFDDFIIKVLPNIFTVVVLMPTIILVVAMLDPLTTLIFLLTLPIAPFLLYLIGGAISKRNQQALAKMSKLNSNFKELIAAITTLKIFKQSNTALERLKVTSKQSAETTLDVLKLAFISAFALELITTLSIALIAVTVGLRLINDSIAFETALFLLILAPEFYLPIRQIGVAFHAVVRASDSINRLRCVLLSYNQDSSRELNSSLIYALRGTGLNITLNLDYLKTSGCVVVIGESGSGKSTLLRELVKEYKNETVAYLPQQSHLFKTSVRNNVTLFKEMDDSLISQALNEVGLNLNLNDKIVGLSRGELQRLGLARILVSGASILILDEPTAALDVNTKQLIINKIVGLKQRHTLIIATHDSELIGFANEIINLTGLSQT
ncbi:MAG: ATP-binding cassette domain-containing protein [Selenomonadaceae bacterium]|nr:ATP-binding cassette domain-containing protein [Selenomonadaceae bacterium]